MSQPTTLIAIPARLESSRLPRKLLADIGGKPLLQRVLERCLAAQRPAAVIVCTDSEELRDVASQWPLPQEVPVVMTPSDCSSGSERLGLALPQLLQHVGVADPGSCWVLNVQGDQPFVDPALIDAMADGCQRTSSPVLTPVYPLPTEKIHNPAVVKCLLAHDGRCLTFSRNAIPHVRDVAPAQWHQHTTYWGHVGIYGYRADVLARWGQLPHSPLEALEKLEQLRLLEAGIPISSLKIEADCLSVDTAEQLEEARTMAAQLR